MRKILVCICFILPLASHAKEYKSIKEYRKLTNKQELSPFDWFKSDRVNNTPRWAQANKFNFTQAGRYKEYTTITQRRDFYKWLHQVLKTEGHEVYSAGLAYVVTDMYSKVETSYGEPFAPKWFINFAKEGTELVMSKLVPRLYKVFTSKYTMTGENAEAWDKDYLRYEQCELIDPLFKKLTAKQLRKMTKIAKGKGLYGLFIDDMLEYNYPSLLDCEDRINYGLEVVMPYAMRVLN